MSLKIPHRITPGYVVHLINRHMPSAGSEDIREYDFNGKYALESGLRNENPQEIWNALGFKIVAGKGYEAVHDFLNAAFCYAAASKAASRLTALDESFRIVDFRCALRTIINGKKAMEKFCEDPDRRNKASNLVSFSQETVIRSLRLPENRFDFLADPNAQAELLLYGDKRHDWFP